MMGFPLPPWCCPPVWRQREKERRLAGKAGMFNKIAQTIRLWASIPEGIAVGIFIGGLEGLFFQMVPIKWMDGHHLWSWNKLVWLGVTGITAFLFWHILPQRGKPVLRHAEQDDAGHRAAAHGPLLRIDLGDVPLLPHQERRAPSPA